MSYDHSILEEFSIEATELLDSAESAILNIDSSNDLQPIYNSTFRAFHSLKGSSGMMGFDALQRHLHLLEDHLQKSQGNLENLKISADYYLKGIDASRKILNGEVVQFKYEVYGEKKSQSNELEEQSVHISKVLVLLKNNNAPLVNKIKKLENQLSLKLDVVVFNDLDDLKKDYSILVTDLESDILKELIPDSKSGVPKLFVSDSLKISDDIRRSYYLKQDDELERYYYMIKLMISESKQFDIFTKAKSLMLYMYSDMEDYLISKNKIEIQKTISKEIKMFIKNYIG